MARAGSAEAWSPEDALENKRERDGGRDGGEVTEREGERGAGRETERKREEGR